MDFLKRYPKYAQFILLLIIFFALYLTVIPSETNILWRLPALFAGVPGGINWFAEHLMYDWFSRLRYMIQNLKNMKPLPLLGN